MAHVRRSAPYLVLLVLIGACGFGAPDDDEPPSVVAPPAPPPAAPAAPAAPFINAPPPGARELRATVTTATGLEGVAPGTECRVWIVPDGSMCQANVECGPHVLWGRGDGSYCPCTQAGTNISGGEDMTTADDGDGAFRFDTAAGTMEVRDSPEGPLGAFDVRATIRP